MKKIILLTALSIGLISCSKDSNSNIENSVPMLIGKKVLKINAIRYNGAIVETETTTLTYKNNYVSKITSVSNGGNKTENEEYTYLDGKLKETYKYTYSTSNGFTNPSTSVYNYTGDLITSIVYDNGSTIYTYNSTDQMITTKYLRSDGTISSIENYEYFTDGNIKKVTYLATSFNSTTNYNTYDNKKNPFELIFTQAEIKIRKYTKNNLTSADNANMEYEYNMDNYPTKSVTKNGTQIRSIVTYEYN